MHYRLTYILTLIQLWSGKSVKYLSPFSFDLALMRHKITSPGIWQARNRALRFRKSAQNVSATIHLERARERAQPKTCLPLHFMWLGTGLEC